MKSPTTRPSRFAARAPRYAGTLLLVSALATAALPSKSQAGSHHTKRMRKRRGAEACRSPVLLGIAQLRTGTGAVNTKNLG